MNPWIPHLLRAGGGGGGAVLPPTGRTMLAKLTSSLILDEGTGGPTWSRATKAWGFNELGYLEEIASGCAFFGGARLVRNTVRTTSEDFSNAAWTKSNCTISGTNTVVCANSTTKQSINQISSAAPVQIGQNVMYLFRVKLIAGGANFLQITGNSAAYGSGQYANFSLIDGTLVATNCTAKSTLVNVDTYDIGIRVVATGSGNVDACSILLINNMAEGREPLFIGDGIKSFQLLRAWSVDVTGYDAAYIPEYVSVGVEASPYFGAGIDGAKYFETDWQGAPIAAANLLGFRREAAATNNLLGSRDFFINWTPDVVAGTLFSDDFSSYADTAAMTAAGWTAASNTTQTLDAAAILITNAAAVYGSSSKSITTEIGKSYLMTFAFTKTTANCSAYVANTAVAGTADRLNNTSVTVTGAYSLVFTATATTTYLVFGLNSNTVGHAIKIDDVLLKESKVTVTKATGLDGIANTATTLTATAADATILQPITLASAARCASAYVKRRTGTGTISFTQDGGSTWTDITAQINSSTWSRVRITSTLANPSVGFKIGTSGDAIDVDCVQNEAGAIATSPIVTTTATVTRNAESLTYQTASNWSDTAGTAYIEVEPYQWSVGGLIGSATNGLLRSASNSGATAYDGTNSANGPTGTPSGRKKLAMRWGGGAMTVTSGGVLGTPGTYDGGMGLSSIGIAINSSLYCCNVAIYNYAMTDAELLAIST